MNYVDFLTKTSPQVAQILSDVTGKPIKHVHITMDIFRNRMEGRLPPSVVESMVEMESEFARNLEANPDNGEVERLTGRKPIRFREWAEENKAAWL
jgi:hypothetical protein